MKRKRTTLTRFARALRANSSDAETRLWWQLRDRRLAGAKFRRQLPVGPYIADFACVRAKLIVELDGGQHSEQGDYDARRTAYLEQRGYRVLRFWNDEVLTELDGVLMMIVQALGRPPHPGPLPHYVGERGQDAFTSPHEVGRGRAEGAGEGRSTPPHPSPLPHARRCVGERE